MGTEFTLVTCPGGTWYIQEIITIIRTNASRTLLLETSVSILH